MARIYSVNSSYRVDTRAILTDQVQNDSNEILRATLREDEFFRQVAFTERGFFVYTYRDYLEVYYSDRTILKLYGEFDDGFDLPVGMLRGYSHFSQSLDLLFVEGFELPFSILDSGIEELIHTKMFEDNDDFYLSKYDDYADSFSGNDIVYGQLGNDTLLGGDGNDYLYGGFGPYRGAWIFVWGKGVYENLNSGDDLIYGQNGNDFIFGENGNDYLVGGAGDDQVDGGSGIDTAVFTGSRSQYSISGSGTSIIVSDKVAGRDGLDTLKDCEFLRFSDQTISTNASWLTGTNGNDAFRIASGSNSVDGAAGSDVVQYQTARSAASITFSNGTITVSKAGGTDTITGVERIDFIDGDLVFDVASSNAPAAYRLYGGAFDRTPDEGGFRYWTQILDRGISLHEVAVNFIISNEFVARYGSSLSNASFVDKTYQNVLGRNGETAGVMYWNEVLDKGYADRAKILELFTQLPEYVGISAADIANGYWVI